MDVPFKENSTVEVGSPKGKGPLGVPDCMTLGTMASTFIPQHLKNAQPNYYSKACLEGTFVAQGVQWAPAHARVPSPLVLFWMERAQVYLPIIQANEKLLSGASSDFMLQIIDHLEVPPIGWALVPPTGISEIIWVAHLFLFGFKLVPFFCRCSKGSP